MPVQHGCAAAAPLTIDDVLDAVELLDGSLLPGLDPTAEGVAERIRERIRTWVAEAEPNISLVDTTGKNVPVTFAEFMRQRYPQGL